MAAKPRGRRSAPKTISRTGVTGQRGVNLIEGIVLDMESRWTLSGPNEVGIDGYIELFDPANRRALGLTLAAQSKAVSGVSADTKPTFDYWCAPADVEYWLAVQHAGDPRLSQTRRPRRRGGYRSRTTSRVDAGQLTTVTFKKAEQRFTKDSLKALVALAAQGRPLPCARAQGRAAAFKSAACRGLPRTDLLRGHGVPLAE